MSDFIYFEPDGLSSYPSQVANNTINLVPTSSPFTTSTGAATTSKPRDDFSTVPLGSHSLFYLTITAPHSDEFTVHGPVKKFKYLFPKLIDVVSNSPRAIDKLEALRNIEDVWGDTTPNTEFEEMGFTTFIVEGQRGVYTVLRIVREENAHVYEELPVPVYTITAHGPLVNSAHTPALAKGYATTSRVVGSFVERIEAQDKAREVMRGLIRDTTGVQVTETWGKGGKGSGMIMAMSPQCRWEVRLAYEDEALLRAKEGMEREGLDVDWRA